MLILSSKPSKFIILMVSLFVSAAHADFIKDTQISGLLKMYDFNREEKAVPSQNAFSLGGGLNVLTGEVFPGLRLDATLFTAQPLGLNSNHSNRVDNTLPGFSVTTLGQAYAQYRQKIFLLQGGYQKLNTPWINSLDIRMIPSTYQAIFTQLKPFQDLTFSALRLTQFKGHSESNYTQTNLYNTNNIGGSPVKAFGNKKNPGAYALGANYTHGDVKVDSWFYQFYDFSQMFYLTGQYSLSSFSSTKPFFAVQLLRETGSGKNYLRTFSGGKANSFLIGFKLGITVKEFKFALGYDKIPETRHGFHHGGVLSPYTTGYTVDPLYTTSMMSGLVEKSSGSAYKFIISHHLFNEKLQLLASYARYFNRPYFANSSEINTDILYNFSNKLTGLSIRYRLGVLNGNISTGRFIYHRIILQYLF